MEVLQRNEEQLRTICALSKRKSLRISMPEPDKLSPVLTDMRAAAQDKPAIFRASPFRRCAPASFLP